MKKPLLVHLTTIDTSLVKLLGRELEIEAQRGFNVVGVSSPGPNKAALATLGVSHVGLTRFTRSWSLRSDLGAAIQLFQFLRSTKPDVLHTHNPKPGILGRILGRVAGVPIVVNTCHGLWTTPNDPLKKRLPVLVVEGIAAQFSDAELFQNPDDREAMSRFLRKRKTSVLVGNGTDLERFRTDPVARHEIRGRLGVTGGDVLVLAVGRLVDEKGVREFVEAAALLKPTHPHVRMVWVGPIDDSRGGLSEGTTGNVKFVGHQDDVVPWYSAADVFVLASYREGLPRSAMEAASCSLPLVLTNIRGCRELGSHEQEVLFIEPQNPRQLADAVGRLANDEELRKRMAFAALQRAHSWFNQDRVAECSIAVYRHVASLPARGQRGARRREMLKVLPDAELRPYET